MQPTDQPLQPIQPVQPMVETINDPEYEYNWLCCTAYKDRGRFKAVLPTLHLSSIQRHMIQTRYISLLENFQKRARNHAIVFFVGHFIITVGSLFVPALLSIQNSDKGYVFGSSSFTVNVYWATFIISLLVTIFNGVLTLFKIDKKYYFLHTTLERLRSEGWQYIGLTGRYSGHLLGPGITPTHQNQFIYFSHYIEKIKMKQVEEEYYKTDEKTLTQTPNAGPMNLQANGKTDLYPPSPNVPLSVIQQSSPEPVSQVMNSLILSQKTIPANIKPSVDETIITIAPTDMTVNPLSHVMSEDDVAGLGLFAPRIKSEKEPVL